MLFHFNLVVIDKLGLRPRRAIWTGDPQMVILWLRVWVNILVCMGELCCLAGAWLLWQRRNLVAFQWGQQGCYVLFEIRETRAKTKAQDKAKRDLNSRPRHSKLSKNNALRRHSKFRGSWEKFMECKEILKTSTKNKWKRQIWDYSIEYLLNRDLSNAPQQVGVPAPQLLARWLSYSMSWDTFTKQRWRWDPRWVTFSPKRPRTDYKTSGKDIRAALVPRWAPIQEKAIWWFLVIKRGGLLAPQKKKEGGWSFCWAMDKHFWNVPSIQEVEKVKGPVWVSWFRGL